MLKKTDNQREISCWFIYWGIKQRRILCIFLIVNPKCSWAEPHQQWLYILLNVKYLYYWWSKILHLLFSYGFQHHDGRVGAGPGLCVGAGLRAEQARGAMGRDDPKSSAATTADPKAQRPQALPWVLALSRGSQTMLGGSLRVQHGWG